MSFFLTLSANGAAFVVTKALNTADGVCNADCSFREALQAANTASSDDSIEFDPAVFSTPQTVGFFGHAFVEANGTLTINGSGVNLLTFDGVNFERILTIKSNANVTINGITFTKGGQRAMDTPLGGGAMRIESGAIVVINNSAITANGAVGVTTEGDGGGIYNLGTLSLNNTVVSNNRTRNNNSYRGGGIFNGSGATFFVTNSTISGNTSDGEGGGICNLSNVATTIVGSTISGNASSNGTDSGGGIYNANGALQITNSQFTSNSTSTSSFARGGAIHHVQGNLSITGTTFINNSAANGGGIFTGGTATITLSTFSGNASTNGTGGGITNTGNLTLDSVTLNNNTTTTTTNFDGGRGGGIFNDGSLSVTNSTFTGNQALRFGGGIASISPMASLESVTLNGNSANGGGGVIGTFSARNTLIGDNSATMSAPDFAGTLNSLGYNLIENTDNTTITGVLTGNILGQDPLLAPLRANGGGTQTVALQAASPAIDAGDPADFAGTDQRGIMRPQDGDLNGTALPDIGAYERKVTTFTATKVEDTGDGSCDADCSLREAIQAANLSAEPDNAVIFGSMFGVPRTIVLTGGELTVGNGGTFLINGPGADLLTVSGNNVSRVFFVNTNSNLTIKGVTAANGNGAGSVGSPHGGAISAFNGVTLLLVNSVVANSRAGGPSGSGTGGGIAISSGVLYLINSTVRDNTCGNNAGGGIYQSNGVVNVINSVVRNNTAPGDGGGFFNIGGNLSIVGSTVDGNSGNDGGGIVTWVGTLSVAYSTVSRNTAREDGGGIGLINATGTIVNSTISGNSAAVNGGGITLGSTTLSLTNVTLAFNAADSDNNGSGHGGGVGGLINARNVLIGKNRAASGPDVFGQIASQGYNLIGNTTGVTITGTNTGNVLGQDPLLLPLGNYGGATLTHALRPTSPAVDRGASATPALTTDQRRLIRPVDFPSIPNAPAGNSSDIGAFERQVNDRTGSIFDFDGDGKTDIGIFRPILGAAEWWINRSGNGQTFALQFGSSTDIITPADYTGDGKTDIAFFRPSSGEWYVLRSEDFSFFALPFGTNGDVPVPADYDADGKADFAVFRPSNSTWFISQSSGAPTRIEQFGSTGDVPVVADYDGDAKADVAIFRQNGAVAEWWINRSTAGSLALQFGASTDKAVPGDYTGDGKADIAIWRPSDGNWLILRSEDFSFFGFPFGTNGDVVAPGDYDGDGKFDPTVFRPSSATWFIGRTTAGTQIVQFGATGDRPIPNAFVP